jgi:hypothetical protein
VHLVGFIIRICHDARSHERKIRLCVRPVLISRRVDVTVTYLCVISCSVEIRTVLTLSDFVIYVEGVRQNAAA